MVTSACNTEVTSIYVSTAVETGINAVCIVLISVKAVP